MPGSQHVAIVGAGLSGLCLALSLHHENIPSTIYETRPEPLDIGGAIMLSPNALRVLNKLGVYQRLEPLGYNFDNLYFRTEDDKLLDTFEFGSTEKFGYTGMRIYRFELINVLLEMLSEAGITPKYGKKFSHVMGEDAEGVTWAFENGSTGSASLLVGADGIHSRVRAHIDAGAAPTFTKMIGVTAAVPREQFGIIDDDYGLPVTIMSKKHGAFIAAPQRRDGSEIFFGKQCHFAEDRDRESWERVIGDKAWGVEFLRQGPEDYPPLVARGVSHIPEDRVNVWPFYVIPKLGSWTSEAGRVVILGDAAHAIPPTAGQGVNQAFEDAYTFARVLSKFGEGGGVPEWQKILKDWQGRRQSRVDRVLQLNADINKRRLPSNSTDEVTAEPFDLGWLYNIDFEEFVDDILSGA